MAFRTDKPLTIISATVLVGVEILVAGVAGGWAVAGMLGLGEVGAWVLEAAGAALALYFVVRFWRSAMTTPAPAE